MSAGAKGMAERLGATYVDDGMCVRVEAPPHHVWSCAMVHEIVCLDDQDAAERMAYGLERCPHPGDCDWCRDVSELRLVT